MAADNYHLDVSPLGTKAILRALSENGQADVAYPWLPRKPSLLGLVDG